MRIELFAGMMALLATLPVWGKIESPQSSITQTLEAGKQETLFEFQLVNSSSSVAKIEMAHAPCPCVQVIDFPKEIASNGEATLSAIFTPNPVGGEQIQQIQLKVAGQETPVVLNLKVSMPLVAEVEPKFLFWKTDGDVQPQKVILKIADATAKVVDVFAMDENFRSKTTVLDDGSREIEVTPVNLSVNRPAMLMIELAIPSREQSLRIGVPCQIGDISPFQIRFNPSAKDLRPDPVVLEKTLEKSKANELPSTKGDTITPNLKPR